MTSSGKSSGHESGSRSKNSTKSVSSASTCKGDRDIAGHKARIQGDQPAAPVDMRLVVQSCRTQRVVGVDDAVVILTTDLIRPLQPQTFLMDASIIEHIRCTPSSFYRVHGEAGLSLPHESVLGTRVSDVVPVGQNDWRLVQCPLNVSSLFEWINSTRTTSSIAIW